MELVWLAPDNDLLKDDVTTFYKYDIYVVLYVPMMLHQRGS